MTDQEKQDLEILKQKETRAYENAFSYIRSIMREKPENLKHYGHKTVEDAIVYRVKSAIKDVDSLTKAFFKKYPDD